MKICVRCGEDKPLSEYWKNNRSIDGLYTYCNICARKRKKEYRKSKDVREREKICNSIYKKSEKYKVYHKKYMKGYREKNEEKIKTQVAVYWGKNTKILTEKNKIRRQKEERQELEKTYRLSDKGKAVKNNYKHKRRAKTKISDIITDWLKDLKSTTTTCELCQCIMNTIYRDKNSKHLDHRTPLNIGGTHTMSNVRYICQTCNLKRPKDGSDIVTVTKCKKVS
jgi:hypothetical protein